jgi:hypothetical protein
MTAKADRARELLNDPLLQEVLDNLRMDYRDACFTQGVSDEDVMELRRMEFLTHRFEAHLKKMISDGELEDFRALEKERQSFLGELKWPRNNH